MEEQDEFLAIFGVAAYGGPAATVAVAWASRQGANAEPQTVAAVSAGQADWATCRAALLSVGACLGFELPETDADGLKPLARMFARRFLAAEVTLEVFVARLQRIYTALGSPENLLPWAELGDELGKLQQATSAEGFSENPLEDLRLRAEALAKSLV